MRARKIFRSERKTISYTRPTTMLQSSQQPMKPMRGVQFIF